MSSPSSSAGWRAAATSSSPGNAAGGGAARAAGLPNIPALVRKSDDRELLVLAPAENAARRIFSHRGGGPYAVLMDEFALSLGEVAERVGRSKPTVSNRVRLLELPEDVLGVVAGAAL